MIIILTRILKNGRPRKTGMPMRMMIVIRSDIDTDARPVLGR